MSDNAKEVSNDIYLCEYFFFHKVFELFEHLSYIIVGCRGAWEKQEHSPAPAEIGPSPWRQYRSWM